MKFKLLNKFKLVVGLGYIHANCSDEIFDIIDHRGMGTITVKELQNFLNKEEVDGVLVNQILEEADKDLDMTLSKIELHDIWQSILSSIPEKLLSDSILLDSETFQHVPSTYDVSFSNLNLHLHSGATVLKNISGKLGAHQVTALMGPSGRHSNY